MMAKVAFASSTLFVLFWVHKLACVDGTTYYVNQESGDDSNSGTSELSPFESIDTGLDLLTPGDTLIIVGTLHNPSYDANYSFDGNVSDSHLWNSENTISMNNIVGTNESWINIIGMYNNNEIKGDGSNIVRIQNCAYIKIINLTINGQVLNIPYSTAKALQFVYKDDNGTIQYRVDPSLNLTDNEINNLTLPIIGSNIERPSYTDTRGIYVSDSHHLLIYNNIISNTPGNGLRVAKSEYVDIIENEVLNTSRKSYSGTHGLVVTYTTDEMEQENEENYRARIVRNVVHHNYNEIYSWVGTKSFIHALIDEGKGISLQRNQEFNNSGRILVANNIAYWNGYSGIHSNDGYNVDFISNTAYMNSYTNTITYANDDSKQSGSNVGVSMDNGINGTIINNIVVIDASTSTTWQGKPISISGDTDGMIVSSNIVYGMGNESLSFDDDLNDLKVYENTIESNPMFNEYLSYSQSDIGIAYDAFKLIKNKSIAIDNGNWGYQGCEDILQNKRINNTIGAIGIGSENIGINVFNNISYLDDCYSFERNVTVDSNDDNIISLTTHVIADGFIRYRENDFKGKLDNLDVKNPTGSDIRETVIRFNNIINDFNFSSNDCQNNTLLNITLFMKSIGGDSDVTNDMKIYFIPYTNNYTIYNNLTIWNENQNDTSNIPSVNNNSILIGSIAIDFRSDEWISIELNRTVINNQIENNNFLFYDSFDIIVTKTVSGGLLEFYSRESGANNTAFVVFDFECFSNNQEDNNDNNNDNNNTNNGDNSDDDNTLNQENSTSTIDVTIASTSATVNESSMPTMMPTSAPQEADNTCKACFHSLLFVIPILYTFIDLQ